MKKLVTSSVVILSVSVALLLIAGILRSITFDTTVFTPTTLANAFATIGYLGAALTGVILAASACVTVAKGGDTKKIIRATIVLVSIGVSLILVSAVFGVIPVATWGTGVGAFNPTSTNALNAILNSLGYLSAVLSGVVLVATGIASIATSEANKK